MSGYFPALHELIGGPDRFQAALQKPFGLHAVRDIVDGLLAQRSDHE
jgi:hypothetical protein